MLAPTRQPRQLERRVAADQALERAQQDLGAAQEPTWSILKLDGNGRAVIVEEGGDEISVDDGRVAIPVRTYVEEPEGGLLADCTRADFDLAGTVIHGISGVAIATWGVAAFEGDEVHPPLGIGIALASGALPVLTPT